MNTKITEFFETTGDLFDESTVAADISDNNDISGEELLRSIIVSEEPDSGSRYFLRTGAFLLKLAHAHNKILSLSNSRTSILAHQVEATHRIVNSLKKRFLIADEVGLGKTVEAGLVLKELIYRNNYSRVLIVCPASLLLQWQHEMNNKFNEKFTIMDRRVHNKLNKGSGSSPLKKLDKVICSLDFIKNKEFAEELKKTRWDIVIIDEAHRLRRDSKQATQAYAVGELLSQKSRAFLLLSATPFRGNLEELYFLISLIDDNLLGPFNTFYNRYCIENADLSGFKEKLSQVVIRRTKKEVGGFTLRHARTVQFELYSDERLLYDETTTYVVEEFNRAMQYENRAVGFVMTVFQKLLDSSSRALSTALKKRKARLSELVKRAQQNSALMSEIYDDYEDSISEDDSINSLIGESAEKTIAELKEEIKTLTRLISIADAIETDKKGEKLVELLRGLKKKGFKKFLIFTQFRTTQDYLAEILEEFSLEIFNGSMDANEKESALERFKKESEILIATEAGGEGRNMQFCSIIINYDLPWSPLKIEQRIGRIHRFGQKSDVYIYNFSTKDTVAERVLEVLTKKLKLFEESMGAPDILLGEIEDELKLNRLFMEMAVGEKKNKTLEHEIEGRIENARKSYEKLSDLAVTSRIDFNYDEYYRITLKERQFSNRRIESFVNILQKADPFSEKYIGKKQDRSGLYPVKPGCIKDIDFYTSGTFDSQQALENERLEFLACGHPIIDTLIDHCKDDGFGGHYGVVAVKHHSPFIAMVFNYVATFISISETAELIPVVIELDGVLSRDDIEELEMELLEQEYTGDAAAVEVAALSEQCRDRIDLYFTAARERVTDKINDRISDMSQSLDLDIYPEMEKIRSSYDQRIRELEEKLSVQEGKMKWYGTDMKGVLTRTSNQLYGVRRERDELLQRYRSYLGIKHGLRLVSAALLVSRD